jgi:hypothetical protein
LRPWLDPKNWPQVLLNLGRWRICKEDYHAAGRMFYQVEAKYIYQTNGFPRAFAVLICAPLRADMR